MLATLALLSVTLAGSIAEEAGSAPSLTAETIRHLTWRGIGPANMGGRIVDLAVHPDRPGTFYVATASGGVFRTTSGGIRMTPIFDQAGSCSIGAVAIAPSSPDVVWVGTGEANPRNSVSWGNGVHRSDDAGKSWTSRGLEETRHVGGIAIHPSDPDLVFVAAMGRTWGPNQERGLFRTRDGGETWERVLFVDENTGCIDVLVDPQEPDRVYAATWQRQRDEFDGGSPATETGPGSGLWRSEDGGDSWARLENGLPTRAMGRIGLDLFCSDPSTLFAIIQTDLTGRRAPGQSEESGGPAYLGVRSSEEAAGAADPPGYLVGSTVEGGPSDSAGLEAGDRITRLGESPVTDLATLREVLAQHEAGDEVEVVVLRDDQELTLAVKLGRQPGQGRGPALRGPQGGQNAAAPEAQGEQGFETGGVFRSDDHGSSWHRLNSLNPRPFYYSQIRVDPTDDQRLYVLGISLHVSSDGGATFSNDAGRGTHPDHHALWIDPRDSEHLILGNDGGLYVSWDRCRTWDFLDVLPIGQFYAVAVDLRRPYRVYGGLQDNGCWGGPSASRRGSIPRDAWVSLNGGDGFRCAVDPTDPDVVYVESQHGAMMRRNLRTGDTHRVVVPRDGIRYNWNTPFLLSPHNPHTLLFAGSEVFRSVDRGASSVSISPEITRTERGSATALAESPRLAGRIYVGTDDGALWVSDDGGRQWVSLFERLPQVPGPRYVSDIAASHHATDRVYVTLDGHRSDDEAAHVFRSDDVGLTWTSLTNGLPAESIRCFAEDPIQDDLLFVGTEFGCYVTVDAGESWAPLRGDLPPVAVHDLVIHPREADLVAATHGRGIWILDLWPLRQLTDRVLASETWLLEIEPAVSWNRLPDSSGYSSLRGYRGKSPSTGASIYYYLGEARDEKVKIEIRDVLGEVLVPLEGPAEAGLQRVEWNLQRQSRRRRGSGTRAEPGDYVVTLQVGEQELSQRLRIEPDPLGLPAPGSFDFLGNEVPTGEGDG